MTKRKHKPRPTTIARQKAIMAEFTRLSAIKDNGVQKYNYPWIIMRLSSRFFLAEATIQKMITTQNQG